MIDKKHIKTEAMAHSSRDIRKLLLKSEASRVCSKAAKVKLSCIEMKQVAAF